MADIQHRDAPGEIDVASAFDVPDFGVFRARRKDGRRGGDPARNSGGTAGKQFCIQTHIGFLASVLISARRRRSRE
jgi:hypothetical protein